MHGQEFLTRTDHKSLLHLENQKVVSKVQQKALLKLMDLRYKIQYKKGITNAATDALSRVMEESIILAISLSTLAWLNRLQQGYEDDDEAKQLLAELSMHEEGSVCIMASSRKRIESRWAITL